LEFSPLGKVLNTIYKPSQAHIIFKFTDSTYSGEYRFIHGATSDGVFVSQYVDGINEFSTILSGNLTPDIDEIIINVGDPSHYEKNFQTKFVGIPAQISIQKSDENIVVPDWRPIKIVYPRYHNIIRKYVHRFISYMINSFFI